MYGTNIWWLIISISLHLFPAIPCTFCSCKWLNKLKVRGIRIAEKRCKQIEIINHQMLIPDMRHIHVYIRTGWHKKTNALHVKNNLTPDQIRIQTHQNNHNQMHTYRKWENHEIRKQSQPKSNNDPYTSSSNNHNQNNHKTKYLNTSENLEKKFKK